MGIGNGVGFGVDSGWIRDRNSGLTPAPLLAAPVLGQFLGVVVKVVIAQRLLGVTVLGKHGNSTGIQWEFNGNSVGI